MFLDEIGSKDIRTKRIRNKNKKDKQGTEKRIKNVKETPRSSYKRNLEKITKFNQVITEETTE